MSSLIWNGVLLGSVLLSIALDFVEGRRQPDEREKLIALKSLAFSHRALLWTLTLFSGLCYFRPGMGALEPLMACVLASLLCRNFGAFLLSTPLLGSHPGPFDSWKCSDTFEELSTEPQGDFMKIQTLLFSILFTFSAASNALPQTRLSIGKFDQGPTPEFVKEWSVISFSEQRGHVQYVHDLVPMTETLADALAKLDAKKLYNCNTKSQLTSIGTADVVLLYDLKNCKECTANAVTKVCE